LPLRVIVADDDPVFVELLQEVLAEADGIEVVGSAGDGIEAVVLVSKLQPDVITIDLDMPLVDGAEASRMILEQHPDTAVILVSGLDAEKNAGDLDYVRKSKVQEELVAAIKRAGEEKRRLRLLRL
jgi:chemotaxis response regulator CheB